MKKRTKVVIGIMVAVLAIMKELWDGCLGNTMIRTMTIDIRRILQ